MGMKWLITGGCGFIGTSLLRSLLKDGDHMVRIVDNLSVGTRGDLGQVAEFATLDPGDGSGDGQFGQWQGVQLIVADILDQELALRAGEGAEVIVHLAANTGVGPSVEDPRFDCVTNVIGTLNYLEAARLNRVKRFVFASSGAPVGECEPPIHEEMAPHPVSPYGASKLAGEGYCSAYFRTFGVETVALRFSNVYGPGSGHKNSVVAKFIKQALHGETLEIYGDGTQTRDFLYIDDLVQAILLAVSKEGIGGEVFQIATATEKTVSEITDILIDVLKERESDKEIEILLSERRLGDVYRNFSDTTKARKVLGWQQGMDLRQGIQKTVNWFCANR